MRISHADWPLYKREARLALVAATVGTILVGGSLHFYRSAGQSFRHAEATLRSSRATLAKLEDERSELEAGLPAYRTLAERSIIGTEDRLNWHETVKAEQRRQAVGKVAFTLTSRRPFQADDAGTAVSQGRFRPYRSTMKLGMEFQRESAFVDFLEGVAGQARALTVIRACRIDRVTDSRPAATWNLGAECTIDWATLEKTPPPDGANPS